MRVKYYGVYVELANDEFYLTTSRDGVISAHKNLPMFAEAGSDSFWVSFKDTNETVDDIRTVGKNKNFNPDAGDVTIESGWSLGTYIYNR